ncbi:hypothetical protein EZU68_05040 (plasmid) [Borrelia miyamotoi]|nr:hypothetical protein EZU68_05040 [Borrelia miyamotoi]QBL99232.1 hypothetical protein EZU71_04985 [Borrelia miyamotoi]
MSRSLISAFNSFLTVSILLFKLASTFSNLMSKFSLRYSMSL